MELSRKLVKFFQGKSRGIFCRFSQKIKCHEIEDTFSAELTHPTVTVVSSAKLGWDKLELNLSIDKKGLLTFNGIQGKTDENRTQQ